MYNHTQEMAILIIETCLINMKNILIIYVEFRMKVILEILQMSKLHQDRF